MIFLKSITNQSIKIKEIALSSIHSCSRFQQFSVYQQTIGWKVKFEKSSKKFREKYSLDYQFFKNVPKDQRIFELERIHARPRNQIELKKNIPKFPIEQIWNYHGLKLMTYEWEPAADVRPRAVVISLSSLNGHASLCGEMAKQLVKIGCIVVGYDYKNFGKSEANNPGLIESFDEIVTISEQYVLQIKQKYRKLKIFVCGMSMGGAIAFKLSIKNPGLTNGVIFLSPSIRENPCHSPFLKKLIILIGHIFPKMRLLKSSGRSGCKYLLNEMVKKDKLLYHDRIWAKTVTELLIAMSQIKKQYKNLSSPYLLIQSGTDKIVDPFAAIDLENQSSSKDKTTVLIDDMWHNVWFDDKATDVVKIIEEWLEERI